MKLNKSTVGLGFIALMFSACDKAAEQDYTPAAPVVTPPAYFSLDYDGNIYIDEEQTSFTIPVYRANTAGTQTVDVNCTVNGDFFSYQLGEEEPVAFTDASGEAAATIPVTFQEGEGETLISIVYPWEDMSASAGTEFKFHFSTEGTATEYFTTEADYTALFIPWEQVVGPKGETAATWKDDVFYSGFQITGAELVWEVDIQKNPLSPGLYRVLNPYAGAPQNSSGDDFQYHGTGDNYMYINATDPDNVYLSDKLGEALPNYDTYYTLSSSYSDISLFDRVSGSIAGEQLDDYENEGYGLGSRKDFESGGATYVDYIEFLPNHFYVYTDGYTFSSDGSLVIVFPGGSGKKEWNDLGMCTYTDAMISCANGMDPVTYQVPVQQNVDNPYIYRLVDPYTTYWVEPTPQDEEYNITIDCSDPNFVIVSPQDTGNWIELRGEFYNAYMLNASYYFTAMVSEHDRMTQAELTALGMNDTFNNGVINIGHAMALMLDADGYIVDGFDCANEGTEGCVVVLPSGSGAPANYVTPAAANAPKAVRNSGKRQSGEMKAVRLFNLGNIKGRR